MLGWVDPSHAGWKATNRRARCDETKRQVVEPRNVKGEQVSDGRMRRANEMESAGLIARWLPHRSGQTSARPEIADATPNYAAVHARAYRPGMTAAGHHLFAFQPRPLSWIQCPSHTSESSSPPEHTHHHQSIRAIQRPSKSVISVRRTVPHLQSTGIGFQRPLQLRSGPWISKDIQGCIHISVAVDEWSLPRKMTDQRACPQGGKPGMFMYRTSKLIRALVSFYKRPEPLYKLITRDTADHRHGLVSLL